MKEQGGQVTADFPLSNNPFHTLSQTDQGDNLAQNNKCAKESAESTRILGPVGTNQSCAEISRATHNYTMEFDR